MNFVAPRMGVFDGRVRPIALLGAPSAIGIRPYASGEARHLDHAPRVLRDLRVGERLGAADLGDVVPPAYRDYLRPAGRARNEPEVAAYCSALGARVACSIGGGRFALVLGGDCSVVLGGLLGARRATGGAVALAYVDAHADFATAAESRTGSVAGMSLALAVGRGDSGLARLGGTAPLVEPADVVLLGRRDEAEPGSGHAALAASPVLDLTEPALRAMGYERGAALALDRLTAPGVQGFWIHLDADVLDPAAMPAVDSPLPGGPTTEALVDLLAPLVHHPMALGLDLTIYDPALDPERSAAARLVGMLEQLLRPAGCSCAA